MLTREENETLTNVGPGTPAGELLRRYWFPVGVASELTAESPTQIVRILGETLVLFRDKSGRVGCLTIVAHTEALRSVMAASRNEGSPAPITVGCTTRRETAWRRRLNLPIANFI